MGKRGDFCAIARKDGKWVVQQVGSNRSKFVSTSEFIAWRETRRMARGAGTTAILFNRDGQVRTQNTYSYINQ